jgi:hypothetical protein
MPTLDVWLTVVHGVTDTTAKDFHRSERVFVRVPLHFRIKRFTLNRDQRPFLAPTANWLSPEDRRNSTMTFRPVLPVRQSAR